MTYYKRDHNLKYISDTLFCCQVIPTAVGINFTTTKKYNLKLKNQRHEINKNKNQRNTINNNHKKQRNINNENQARSLLIILFNKVILNYPGKYCV